MDRSLGARLAAGPNALNAVRLTLALAVILGHTYPLSGRAEGHVWGLSQVAVEGFFVLSGFLIAGSRMRLPLGRFLAHRALRILPGFYVCLAVVGFGFAPLAARIAGEPWRPYDGLAHVVRNGLVDMRDYGVGRTLASVPYAGAWDGSLWSLWFELLAYVGAGLLLTLPWARRHLRLVAPALAVACSGLFVLAAQAWPEGHLDTVQGLRLFGFFAAGMGLWAWRDVVPRSAGLAAAALGVEVVLFLGDPVLRQALSPLPLGYLLLTVGSTRRVTLGSRNDLSYGVYVYGWPVQQLLMVLGLAHLGVPVLFALATALVLPLAWLSWVLVERPALRLKRRRGRADQAPAAPVVEPVTA